MRVLKKRTTNQEKKIAPKAITKKKMVDTRKCACQNHVIWMGEIAKTPYVRSINSSSFGHRIILRMESAGYLKGPFLCQCCYTYFRKNIDCNQPAVKSTETSKSNLSAIAEDELDEGTSNQSTSNVSAIAEDELDEGTSNQSALNTPVVMEKNTELDTQVAMEKNTELDTQVAMEMEDHQQSTKKETIDTVLCKLNALLDMDESGGGGIDVKLMGRTLQLLGKRIEERMM